MEKGITFTSIFLGIIGAVFISASSFYVVLKYGALPWPTIMATLISMSCLSLLGKRNKNEINITHTIMSSGSMVAGGVAFTVPAYILLGGKVEDINPILLLITILIGSILGAFLSFLIRGKLIEDNKLEFPIGIAAFELIDNGNNKKNMIFVGLGALFSSVISLLRDVPFRAGKTLLPTIYTSKSGFLTFYVSPLLVGIGYILGFLNTFTWFLGGILTYWVAKPYAIKHGIADFDIMKNSFGMGFIIGIGLSIVVKILFTKDKNSKIKSSRIGMLVISIIFIAIITFVYKLPIIISLVIIIITMISAVIAGYTTGKTGINPMEIYAIVTILIVTFLGALFNSLNIDNFIYNSLFSSNISMLYLFLIACIVSVACGLAGDILNDFKAGYKLKTSPVAQLTGEIIGAAVSSVVITLLFFVFFKVYKNIGPSAQNPDLIVFQASIIASIVKGVPFFNIFLIGIGAGFILSLLRLPVLTFGIGIYLPLALTIPVFVGGFLSFIFSVIPKKPVDDFMFFSNGLMAGEAIIGVIISIIAYITLF
ncbi:MAG: OPT/YSL family transporter [Sebaldella sp.]|nr:OPT/YSL family transporter [Sebaldella sp.]